MLLKTPIYFGTRENLPGFARQKWPTPGPREGAIWREARPCFGARQMLLGGQAPSPWAVDRFPIHAAGCGNWTRYAPLARMMENQPARLRRGWYRWPPPCTAPNRVLDMGRFKRAEVVNSWRAPRPIYAVSWNVQFQSLLAFALRFGLGSRLRGMSDIGIWSGAQETPKDGIELQFWGLWGFRPWVVRTESANDVIILSGGRRSRTAIPGRIVRGL